MLGARVWAVGSWICSLLSAELQMFSFSVVRERTVKISKGTGEYPWGFRIQFSKPIVVTEVDTSE